MAQTPETGEYGGGTPLTGSPVNLASVASIDIHNVWTAGVIAAGFNKFFRRNSRVAIGALRAKFWKRVYTLTTTGSGGTVRLAIGGRVTGTINYNGAHGDVGTALVAVYDTNGDSNLTTAGGALSTNPVTLTTSEDTTVTLCDYITITVSGTPTGGTFPITVNGQTATIAYNASTANVQAAINALYTGAKCVVTGSGDLPGNVHTLIVPTGTSVSLGTHALTGGTSPSVALGTAVNHLLTSGSVTLSKVDTPYEVLWMQANPTLITGFGASGSEMPVECGDLVLRNGDTQADIYRARIPYAQLVKVANWGSLTAAVLYP